MRSSRVLRARLARAAALPLLVLTLLFGASSLAVALDDATVADGNLVLAAEGGEHGELPGLEPRTPDDENNEFAPDDYEPNFLWGAAIGFGFLVAGGIAALGGLYWLMVVRPSQQAPSKQG